MDSPNLSPADLTRLIERVEHIDYLLERIEQYYYPPKWKRVLKFTFTHLITIISLVSLAYITWKIWGIVDSLQGQVGFLKESVGGLLNGAKFW